MYIYIIKPFFTQCILIVFPLPSAPPRSFPPPSPPNFMFSYSFSLVKKKISNPTKKIKENKKKQYDKISMPNKMPTTAPHTPKKKSLLCIGQLLLNMGPTLECG